MDKLGKKDFKGWMRLKEKLHYGNKCRSVKEGEIWWSSVGENVGVEICGKGKGYTRPVIVFKKLNRYSFWAIPLTSKAHKGSWYIQFCFQGNIETAVLSQVHCMSVRRLNRKIGQLSKFDFDKVRVAFLGLLGIK